MSAKDLFENLRYGHCITSLDEPNTARLAYQAIQNTFSDGKWEDSFFENNYSRLAQKEFFTLAHKDLPNSLQVCTSYFLELHQLSVDLLLRIGKELQMDSDYLLSLLDKPLCQIGKTPNLFLRAFRYFAQPNSPSSFTADLHQDLSLFTIILRSNCPALQVYDFLENRWDDIEEHAAENDVIILAGEMLSLMSNELYLPSNHRIVSTPIDRYSLVFSFSFREDALLSSEKFTTAKTGQFNRPFSMTVAEFIAQEKQIRTSVNGLY